ncbi:MAG TPA: protein-glutamate O-methyltransferase CheR [Gammaproteobacteria bacterium]|nr:protein-glutamate O-methyltransferase CheR [Gammaproteobacteria bacterium]
MNAKEREKLEIEILLDGIQKRYGYDFRDYASASLKRRLEHNLITSKSKNFIELLDKVLHNEKAFENLLLDLSVTVTEMFRDPHIYDAVHKYIVPVLKTYPYIKIWHAGCATGEEVYSMAILLHEEGLLERTHIYATDVNMHALEVGKEGIYPAEQMKQYAKNYISAGGKRSLSDYYHAKYGSAKIDDYLKTNITFAYHNLAVDHSFCEVQMIICRNVLIYFNKKLQDRVFDLFDDSLVHGGFLFLGSKESLEFSSVKHNYECIVAKEQLYRKLYPSGGNK